MSGWPSSSLLLREHQIQSLGTVALSLPQESFVNFAFWPRYYSLVGPELCEFAIALLNFSPKTVTNDRWQNVQRVLNETKTCHICRIDLFQACVKKTVSNPFTKMLAHWSGGGFLQLCFVTQWKHCTIGELEAWPEAPTNRSPCLLVAPSCNPSQAPLCVFLCLYCGCLCVFVSENMMSWLSGGLTFTDIPGHSNANLSFKMSSPS